jgi:hypothetical protein
VSVTTGWSGIVWEGQPLGFSEENAKMLFTARPWIRDQMDAFMADRSNFFGKA